MPHSRQGQGDDLVYLATLSDSGIGFMDKDVELALANCTGKPVAEVRKWFKRQKRRQQFLGVKENTPGHHITPQVQAQLQQAGVQADQLIQVKNSPTALQHWGILAGGSSRNLVPANRQVTAGSVGDAIRPIGPHAPVFASYEPRKTGPPIKSLSPQDPYARYLMSMIADFDQDARRFVEQGQRNLYTTAPSPQKMPGVQGGVTATFAVPPRMNVGFAPRRSDTFSAAQPPLTHRRMPAAAAVAVHTPSPVVKNSILSPATGFSMSMPPAPARQSSAPAGVPQMPIPLPKGWTPPYVSPVVLSMKPKLKAQLSEPAISVGICPVVKGPGGYRSRVQLYKPGRFEIAPYDISERLPWTATCDPVFDVGGYKPNGDLLYRPAPAPKFQ